MAESISEGTLKQWNKQIGDFVEQDEEIATIETDKVCDLFGNGPICSNPHGQIDVAVNAPASGTIKEFLANEEDTVTVGQALVRIELGGSAPKGDEEANDVADKSEAEAPPEKSAPAAAEIESKPQAKGVKPAEQSDTGSASETKVSSTPASHSKRDPTTSPNQGSSAPANAASSAFGSRDERRVRAERRDFSVSC